MLRKELEAMRTHAIPDDDGETELSHAAPNDPSTGWVNAAEDASRPFNVTTNNETSQVRPAVITDEEDRLADNPSAELLRLHHKFGHSPFPKLQEMAKRGILPKRLAKCHIPV